MELVWRHRVCEALGYAAIVGVMVAAALGVTGVLGKEWVQIAIVLAIVGAVLLYIRSGSRAALWIRIHQRGRPASATVTRLRKRGTWGLGGSESSPADPYTWFDLWMRVVPADPSVPAFDAFVNQGVDPAQAHLVAAGMTLPVRFDPGTGLATLVSGDASTTVGSRTIHRLGAMRRRNRRAEGR